LGIAQLALQENMTSHDCSICAIELKSKTEGRVLAHVLARAQLRAKGQQHPTFLADPMIQIRTTPNTQ
jgi:hypothetical protein